MGFGEDIFSKTKEKEPFKIQLDERNLPFHDALDYFVFLYISTACLRRRLPSIIKNDRSKRIILDQWKITPLCCSVHLVLYLDSQLGSAVLSRSSRPKVFCKKGVFRNFVNFTGKHLCQRPATLLKKRLWRRCFLVKFAKFLRTFCLQNTSGRCF